MPWMDFVFSYIQPYSINLKLNHWIFQPTTINLKSKYWFQLGYRHAQWHREVGGSVGFERRREAH